MKKIFILLLILFACSTSPEDCAGISNGNATIDDCGLCTGGTTGIVRNYLQDCEGNCGGDATNLDCCDAVEWTSDCTGCGTAIPSGMCDCASTAPDVVTNCCSDGLGANEEVQDCAGVCGGTSSATGHNMSYISAGYIHALALTSDGQIIGWGNNDYGQIDIPEGLNNVIAISTFYYHSLALTSTGEVVAWGRNSYGETDVPEGLNNVIAIDTGYYHSLALTSTGEVVAWGRDSGGILDVPEDLNNVVDIAAGDWHNLALTSTGEVVGWGKNGNGQIDIPANLSNVIAIDVGNWTSFALTSTGEVFAWGDNSSGQLDVPTKVSNNFIVAIDSGKRHVGAVTSGGQYFIWGRPDFNSIQYNFGEPLQGFSNIRAISGGWYFGIVLDSNGNIMGWGSNSYGQLNIPTNYTWKLDVSCN